MSRYEDFAFIYDELMSEVDYDRWAKFIDGKLKSHDREVRMVCELGCGTGAMTARLSRMGYEMIGIDLSESMLMIAREKASETGEDILYLQQDMTEFELYGTVDAVIATCDSFNYVDSEGLKKVFKLMDNYLHPGGLFIFDLNTEYKFREVYGDRTFSEVGEDFAYIWENSYDETAKVNEYNITFFVEEDEGYGRFEEYHQEYVHTFEEVENLAKERGFVIAGKVDDYGDEEVSEKTQRVTYILRKGN